MEEPTMNLWRCPQCNQQSKNQFESEYIETQGVCSFCDKQKMEDIIEVIYD